MRSVTCEGVVVDGEALRAGAREVLDNVVVIDLPWAGHDEMDVVPDQDLADQEDVDADQAVALKWCLEPTVGLETVLATGAVHLEAVTAEVVELDSERYRASWSVRLKLRDAPLLRELAQAMCGDDEPARASVDRSVTAAWERVADPFAPLAAVPGVRWEAGEVDVEQVFARARPSAG